MVSDKTNKVRVKTHNKAMFLEILMQEYYDLQERKTYKR